MQIRNMLGKIAEWPVIYWVLSAFLLAYLLFFIGPVFLNSDHSMKFFVYVPVQEVIGQDLNYMLDYCRSWLIDHSTPYIGHNLYPPLAMVVFSPFLLLKPSTAYLVIAMLIILGFTFTTFALPILVNAQKKVTLTTLLLLLTGLSSYGLQFELEKGQFNMIAFFLCTLAIYLYHYEPRLRILAYILFTFSVQLKVYPAIFVLMLIDDWTKWKQILIRIVGLALVNIALLFVLGFGTFIDFFRAIKSQTLNPYIVMNNLSIKAFTELLFRKNGFRAYFLEGGMSLDQVHALA